MSEFETSPEAEKKYDWVERYLEIDKSLCQEPVEENIKDFFNFLDEMIASLESDPPTANDIQERDEKQKHIIEAIQQNPIFFTKALEAVKEYKKVMSENNCAPLSYYSVL